MRFKALSGLLWFTVGVLFMSKFRLRTLKQLWVGISDLCFRWSHTQMATRQT